MILKGLQKGDNKLRKFTFNDEEYVEKDGRYYYKVNYGKNKLEGEYAEDEIGYVEVSKVLTLGGMKPKPIPELQTPEPVQVTVAKQDEKPKRGRPPKVKSQEVSNETYPVAQPGAAKFEYFVTGLDAKDEKELQNKLNSLGQEGWEMCGMESIRSLFGNIHIVVVLKRKRG